MRSPIDKPHLATNKFAQHTQASSTPPDTTMAPTIEERLAFLESTLVGVQQNVTGVASDVANIQANDDGTGSAIFLSASDADTFWLIWAGVTVFFMQCGFGMLEAGSVTARATQHILLKNLLDTSVSAVVWFSHAQVGCSFCRIGRLMFYFAQASLLRGRS